jgi:hypothetical protein
VGVEVGVGVEVEVGVGVEVEIGVGVGAEVEVDVPCCVIGGDFVSSLTNEAVDGDGFGEISAALTPPVIGAKTSITTQNKIRYLFKFICPEGMCESKQTNPRGIHDRAKS